MGSDVLSFDEQELRGADSNSLLRLYDLAGVIRGKLTGQAERLRADKAIQRLSRELRKRNIAP